ncbi:MAG: hypothetical protein R2758_14315 [Bacteroidales bacterium]
MHKTLAIIAAILLMTGCNTAEVRTGGPADKSATPETVNMLAGLKHAAGEGIMFGHQDDLSYGIGWVYPGANLTLSGSRVTTRPSTGWTSGTSSTVRQSILTRFPLQT